MCYFLQLKGWTLHKLTEGKKGLFKREALIHLIATVSSGNESWVIKETFNSLKTAVLQKDLIDQNFQIKTNLLAIGESRITIRTKGITLSSWLLLEDLKNLVIICILEGPYKDNIPAGLACEIIRMAYTKLYICNTGIL